MGTVCARCSEVEKGKSGGTLPPPDELEELEGSDEDHEDDGSEVVASSDGELDPNEYKQDVIDTLKTTGTNLKRGKTMAMKEAISTAKKLDLEKGVIEIAEKQLDEHKRRQRREACEEEVNQFFEAKSANEIPQAEKMVKKAKECECSPQVIEKLEKHHELLVVTRPLEVDESDQAREYMKFSCTNFVMAATRGPGRPVVFLNLESGMKTSAVMSLDAPLQNLIITIEDADAAAMQCAIITLHATPAIKDAMVRNSKGFSKLEKDDAEGAVALKHEIEGKGGVWCLVEPTRVRRDRLVEALVILSEACKGL